MKRIETDRAPKAIGPYSQAVEAGGWVFLSGQIPIDPSSGKIVETTIEGQTKQVLDNLAAVLHAAGLDFGDVVRAEVFMKDLNDFQKMNALFAERFSGSVKPARQAIQAARLPMDALIEISCIAIKRIGSV